METPNNIEELHTFLYEFLEHPLVTFENKDSLNHLSCNKDLFCRVTTKYLLKFCYKVIIWKSVIELLHLFLMYLILAQRC